MNVLWVYFLTFAGFFDNIVLAMAITPLAFLIYLVKVFPFNFLWCVIPGTISMLISIIYTGITISQYHHTDLILISNLYYVANFLLWFIIQIPYVVFMGLGSFFVSQLAWRGRKNN